MRVLVTKSHRPRLERGPRLPADSRPLICCLRQKEKSEEEGEEGGGIAREKDKKREGKSYKGHEATGLPPALGLELWMN